MDCVNVNGGVMVFGYLFGFSGVWLIIMLLYELEWFDCELGFVMMCMVGGIGIGMLL